MLEVPHGFIRFLGKCKASVVAKDDRVSREEEEEVVGEEEGDCCANDGDDVILSVLRISGSNIMSQRIGCFANIDRGETTSLFHNGDAASSWLTVLASLQDVCRRTIGAVRVMVAIVVMLIQ
jgi:hypothetical protein